MVADAASDICLALIAGSDTSASVFFDTCKPSLGCTDRTQGDCVFTYTYAITKPAGAYSLYVRLCPPGVALPPANYVAVAGVPHACDVALSPYSITIATDRAAAPYTLPTTVGLGTSCMPCHRQAFGTSFLE